MTDNSNGNANHICVITNSYPFGDISLQPFVEQLVITLIDMGVHCDVIAPRSVTNSIIRKIPLPPKVYQATTHGGKAYTVYFPRHITLSSTGKIFGALLERLNLQFFTRAAKKAVKRNNIVPDLFYGHFFNPGGLAAADIAFVYNKPYFVACGENYFDSLDKMGREWVRNKLKSMSGVVSVSSNNKRELVKRGYANEESIEVFINSVNQEVFYPRDKAEMRKKYGFDEDAFIVCFVGRFLEVKGSKRLASALDQLDDVYSIFLGTDSEYPTCKNMLYCGAVPHSQVPEYLSLSDAFVLPTLAEGCCNAIIEAMACGLPVISSDLPFNDDILDDDCSLRIDPTDVGAIRDAIILLRDNYEIRNKMTIAAISKVKDLNIEKRADNILRFLSKRLRKGSEKHGS